MAGKKEKPLQEWVEEITTANNNNFKMIEVLVQRGSSLNERLELVEMLVADARISMNKVLDHLNITIEEEGE